MGLVSDSDFVWKIQSITNSDTPAKHIKAAGGKWNKQKKLREAAYRSIKVMGVEERITEPP